MSFRVCPVVCCLALFSYVQITASTLRNRPLAKPLVRQVPDDVERCAEDPSSLAPEVHKHKVWHKLLHQRAHRSNPGMHALLGQVYNFITILNRMDCVA